MKRYLFLCVCCASVWAGEVRAQDRTWVLPTDYDSTKLYRIELKDRITLVGNILRMDSLFLTLRTSSVPRIEVPFQEIRTLVEVNARAKDFAANWFANPHPTRYFFGPSAFNLERGRGYYQNTYLFLNSFNIGITDNFSVGGGFEFISTLVSVANGRFDAIFFLTPKVTTKVHEKVRLGTGVLYVSVPDFGGGPRSNFGIGYGVVTYGTTDRNVTAGLGWGFVENEFSSRPVVTVSGMRRVSRNVALISENWLVPTTQYYGVFGYGLRFFGEQLAVDLGFINNREIASFLLIGLPYVDFTVKF